MDAINDEALFAMLDPLAQYMDHHPDPTLRIGAAATLHLADLAVLP